MNTDKLVFALNAEEVIYIQEAFYELFFILTLSNNPKQRMKHYITKKKNNNKGNVKKVFRLMLSGEDLEGGIVSNVDDCLRDYIFIRGLK